MAEQKFEVGQKVKVLTSIIPEQRGAIGIIADTDEDGACEVHFENGVVEYFLARELAPAEAPAATPAAAVDSGAENYAVGQEVILLDGTSLIGRVIEKGYKVSLDGGEGRWYTADELAAYVSSNRAAD